MWAAAGLVLKALASGAWKVLRALPWWLYVAAVVLLAGYRWHANAVTSAAHSAGLAAYAEGDQSARRELAILLAQAHASAAEQMARAETYYTQASNAEGKARALEAGLNRCIGTRTAMDVITSAVLRGREQQRAAAVVALTATQRELSDAYASTADRCADQPVPAAVIRVLDAAAFGAPGATGTDAGGGDPGAEVRARTVSADGSDPGAAEAGTTYRDLPDWIIGWAGALSACNADKVSISNLRTDARP